MTVIELPDEQAAALKAKANAAGLTLEAWLQKLAAEHERLPSRPHRHIADVICENMQDVPPEIMARMPQDGASQHDHYLYGWPKSKTGSRAKTWHGLTDRTTSPQTVPNC